MKSLLVAIIVACFFNAPIWAQPLLPPPKSSTPPLGPSVSLSPVVGTPTESPSANEPMPLGPMARLLNADAVRTKLGITKTAAKLPNLANIKIAVLDFGFEGCDPKKLGFPTGSSLIEHYPAEWVKANSLGDPEYSKGFEPGNTHGRLMAQSAWAVAGNSTKGPIFHLLNANGPTMFRRAVKHAIEQQVQIILFSGHFEGGGNYDGKGSINEVVNEAIRVGIIWVNAAGNHRGRVYNGPITPGKDGLLRFGPLQKASLTFMNKLDENNFTITLTWNDYADHEDAGTTKDLDLIVENASTGKEIGRSKLKQISGSKSAEEGESRNPRERLTLPSLGAGGYRIRIEVKSGEFTAKDRLRVLLSPSRGEPFPHPETGQLTDPVQFVDGSVGEEIFPPADNPRVLTVGEISDYSAQGPTADRRLKPDLLLPFLPAKWSNGEVAGGTSYSAAYFAGLVATLKAEYPTLSTNDLMGWLAELRKPLRKVVKGVPTKPEPVPWRTPTAAEMTTILGMKTTR